MKKTNLYSQCDPSTVPIPNIVFMKYGFHASEDGASIIGRKLLEEEVCGMMFWGYGGTVCHPVSQIQPFLRKNFAANEKTYLLLSKIETTWRGSASRAQLFSSDRDNWQPIPEGINVLGSKYALMCKGFQETNFELNLSEYEVVFGKRAGASLADYIGGHATKGCGKLSTEKTIRIPRFVTISAIAEIEDAVFVG